MRVVTLEHEEDFDGWRDAARSLALARVPPADVAWSVGGAQDLFGDEAVLGSDGPPFSVPRPFVELARAAICHSDPERFSLLYALLLRLRAQPKAMDDAADPLVGRLERMAKEVRRDMHKMHAFVRFREVATDQGTRYVAWFEPEHHIVRSNAGFFVRRFNSMAWSILTPELSAHWDGEALGFSAGATRADAPDGDPVEETWKTYYASIFNPARVKVKAMTKEMPKKYWKNMPETALVGELIAGAQAREAQMVETARTKIGGNVRAAWEAVREEAMGCTRCDLYKCGTQTVFGEGPLDAKNMFVGEQPGDQEDLAGVRLGMDALLPARDELEMLDRVGDIGPRPVDPGLGQGRVEQLSGGADERPPGKILLVARLLADEQDPRVERPLAEHGLGRALVEMAAGAFCGLGAQRFP